MSSLTDLLEVSAKKQKTDDSAEKTDQPQRSFLFVIHCSMCGTAQVECVAESETTEQQRTLIEALQASDNEWNLDESAEGIVLAYYLGLECVSRELADEAADELLIELDEESLKSTCSGLGSFNVLHTNVVLVPINL